MSRGAALLLLAIVAPAAARGEASLRVTLTPAAPQIGDPVEAVLELRAAAAELHGEPRFPAWQKTWGDAEVRRFDPPQRRTEGGEVVIRQRVVLAAFRTGEVRLPPVAVDAPLATGDRQLATPADLEIKVRSVLPAGDPPPPKPALPPRPLPLGERFGWTAAAGFALAAAGVIALALLPARRAPAGAGPPALPPLEELERELRALEGDHARQATELVHTRLSLALRRYLGRTAGFHALESTTSEIERELRRHALPRDAARLAARLLRDCDQVKFARAESTAAATAARLGTARAAAQAMEAHLHPPPPSPETA